MMERSSSVSALLVNISSASALWALDNTGRDARDGSANGNIAGHDSSRSDHRPRPNCHPGHDDGPTSDGCSPSDVHRLPLPGPRGSIGHIRVTVVDEHHSVADKD